MSPREAHILRERLARYRSLLQREADVEPLARLVDLLESELRQRDDAGVRDASRA